MYYAIPTPQKQKPIIKLTMTGDNDVNYNKKNYINALADDIIGVGKLCSEYGVADEVISKILFKKYET